MKNLTLLLLAFGLAMNLDAAEPDKSTKAAHRNSYLLALQSAYKQIAPYIDEGITTTANETFAAPDDYCDDHLRGLSDYAFEELDRGLAVARFYHNEKIKALGTLKGEERLNADYAYDEAYFNHYKERLIPPVMFTIRKFDLKRTMDSYEARKQ